VQNQTDTPCDLLTMSNISHCVQRILKCYDNCFYRIVELIGWIVFGISALLLVIAHHIDNYQSPPPADVVQTK
jgi:hypothetical protein